MQFTTNIQPILLDSNQPSNSYVDRWFTVAGWGALSKGGSQPNNLRKVGVKVWTNQRCKSSYGRSAPGGITSHMLCAGNNISDSCEVSVI